MILYNTSYFLPTLYYYYCSIFITMRLGLAYHLLNLYSILFKVQGKEAEVFA